ncbi:hypothetical protein [Microbacterium sp. LWH3-1.2]|uniref:hypothetical protein n=1 Tax=Microbacterium sp. LWH3-1.2 TaxID=3135256 RepID=UPI003422B877
MEDEIAFVLPRDAPAVVVQVHVVERAQQDAAVDVGAASVCKGIDVMRLAVRCGSVARGDAASAVADRERDPLPGGEEPRFSPRIEGIARRVERDGHRAGGAGAGADEPAGERGARVFDQSDRRSPGLSVIVSRSRDEDADACLARAEHGRRVGERAGADHLHHQVVRELVVAARVIRLDPP